MMLFSLTLFNTPQAAQLHTGNTKMFLKLKGVGGIKKGDPENRSFKSFPPLERVKDYKVSLSLGTLHLPLWGKIGGFSGIEPGQIWTRNAVRMA